METEASYHTSLDPPDDLAQPLFDFIAELERTGILSPDSKLAIQVTAELPYFQQKALEWMQLNDWIRLIDVTPIKHGQGVFRIFRLLPIATAFMRRKRLA